MSLRVGVWGLPYGLCVDVYQNEAWWEGAVFDQEDGSEERLIFIPNSGTEIKIGIDMLRITQDWDLTTGEVKPRGKWLFLELVEGLEREQKQPLGVSMKEMWLGVSAKEMWLAVQDKVKDCTCSVKPLLSELVSETFKELVDSKGLVQERTVVDVNSDADLANSRFDLVNPNAVGISRTDFEADCMVIGEEADGPVLDVKLDNKLNNDVVIVDEGNQIDEKPTKPTKSKGRKAAGSWKLAGSNIIGRAKYCPNAIIKYAVKGKNPHDPAVVDIRKHLSYLGWKIEYIRDKHVDVFRFRYTSPDDGKRYFSLVQLCQHLRESTMEIPSPISPDESNSLIVSQNDIIISSSSKDTNVCPEIKGLSSDDILVVEPEQCPEAVVVVDESNEKNLINPDAVVVTSIGAITSSGGGVSSTDCNKIDEKPTKSRCRLSWQLAGPDIIGGAKYCPNAVIKYALKSTNSRDLAAVVDVRQHLSYLGWKIECVSFNGQIDVFRFRYTSPHGKRYMSLVQLCQDLKESTMEIPPPISQDESASQNDIIISSSSKDTNGISSDHILVVEPEQCPEAVVYWYLHGLDTKQRKEEDMKASDITLKARKHLSFLGWVIWYYYRGTSRELRYTSPSGAKYNSLRTACKACIDGGQMPEWLASSEKLSSSTTNAKLKESFVPSSTPQSKKRQSKKRKRKDNLSDDEYGGIKSKTLKKLGDEPKGSQPTRVLRSRKSVRQEVLPSQLTRAVQSSKSARQEVLPSLPYRNPRTTLSWLIDNNAVLPGDKVHYRGRNGGPPLATGRITRDGIECNCCHELFAVSGFEAHAGSSNHRPAANIILEDGRSLFDCQIQVGHDGKTRSSTGKKPQGMNNGNCHQDDNDYICSVCQCGGDLILCDRCPSSFHKSCLGLKYVPDGDWCCPSCCCGICRQSKVTEGSEHSADNSVLTCDQCEQKYHAGCLRSRGVVKLESLPHDKWFCSSRCEKIYSGLHELLGRPIPVSVNNLKWTLLKATESDIDSENYRKLNVALEVMHECFQPCKEAYTGRDLVEDVIFCRRSELNRLNFKGFYTVLLENKEELISVANVRVYGNKVAEVPLVATRFKFRRLGMCRMLMNELEKKLKELGVERLVLPAVPSVLDAWTTSFGFSKMTDSERIQFLNYTFLDFQGTIMCQKLLVKRPSPRQGSSSTVADDVPRSSNEIEFDWSNHKSEVLQVEHIEESGVVNQCLMECS